MPHRCDHSHLDYSWEFGRVQLEVVTHRGAREKCALKKVHVDVGSNRAQASHVEIGTVESVGWLVGGEPAVYEPLISGSRVVLTHVIRL
jgi:hypothetical protein